MELSNFNPYKALASLVALGVGVLLIWLMLLWYGERRFSAGVQQERSALASAQAKLIQERKLLDAQIFKQAYISDLTDVRSELNRMLGYDADETNRSKVCARVCPSSLQPNEGHCESSDGTVYTIPSFEASEDLSEEEILTIEGMGWIK